MTKECVTKINIECRHGSGHPIWNITMFAEPDKKTKKSSESLSYRELVCMAEIILRSAKNLNSKDGWIAVNADVMAWSGSNKPNYLGIGTPHEYRVTLDMENEKDMVEGGLVSDMVKE